MTERVLSWEGCLNVRDLGGHVTGDGRTTRFGAVVRADNVQHLTEAGWAALVDYGVRTIIDLRGTTNGRSTSRSSRRSTSSTSPSTTGTSARSTRSGAARVETRTASALRTA